MTSTAWWHDFHYSHGVMHVKATGAAVPVEPGVISLSLRWLRFHLCIEAERRAIPADGPAIWFAPDRPRPWYLIWPTLALSGLKLARAPQEAQLAFRFEDRTACGPDGAGLALPTINRACADISKSHVAAAFEAVSGRALALDPRTADGPFVEKSETNAAHDGRILTSACDAREGFAYQRLIETAGPDGCVEDWRCCMVGGEIAALFLKRRPAANRFSNTNREIRLADPQTAFTADERELIARFAAALGLDWGGIDVLRERATGLIWIVDANKTDIGPPAALPLREKLIATRRLAASLRAYADRLAGQG